MQGLYGFDAEMFDRVSHDALLDVTYGQFFSDSLAGSLTLSSGFAYSDVRRVESRNYYSHPKSFSVGLSPLLVYYLPTKIPLDLFLGGDVYYSYRFAFEEHSRGDRCIYGAENELLYRVKTGPSYTMKRSGKTRLYQLRFLVAFNVQSQIPDRFTLTPNVLFESQGHEVRGGYLFNLGFDLGMLKKSWSLSYGLRF